MPGERYVRIARHRDFTKNPAGFLVPRPDASRPRGMFGYLKRGIIGSPIPTALEVHERLTKVKALAVFSSDALSSVAYATEEIMKVLVLGGLGAALADAADLGADRGPAGHRRASRTGRRSGPTRRAAAATSSPATTSGELPGLTAAASLLIDYVLTVVGLDRGRRGGAHLAVPDLLPYAVELSVGGRRPDHAGQPARHPRVGRDLRRADLCVRRDDVRPASAYGLYRLLRRRHRRTCAPESAAARPATRRSACSSDVRPSPQGCTAMTGTEAISNGVPAFKPPECAATPARRWSGWACCWATMFLGMSFLATQHRGRPGRGETVLSQIGRAIFGGGAALGRAPGRDGADPDPGGQHRLRRLPAPGLDPGPRPVPAARLPVPRRPAGVHDRHRRAGGPRRRAAGRCSTAAWTS